MKKTKRNSLIIVLVVVLLALAIGYAAFSSTLTINGNVNGAASWDIKFTEAKLLAADGTTAADTSYGTATISEDGLTVTATIKLSYPGDGVILQTVVTNNGQIPAKLKSVNITNPTSADVKVTPATPTEGEELVARGKCKTQYVIKWDSNSTATSVNDTFKVTFTYEQNTTDFNGTGAHTNA